MRNGSQCCALPERALKRRHDHNRRYFQAWDEAQREAAAELGRESHKPSLYDAKFTAAIERHLDPPRPRLADHPTSGWHVARLMAGLSLEAHGRARALLGQPKNHTHADIIKALKAHPDPGGSGELVWPLVIGFRWR